MAALRYQAGDLSLAASGKQNESLSHLGQVLDVEGRVFAAAGYVGVGDDVAQVAVPLLRLGQQGEVGAVIEGDLRSGDGLNLQGPGNLGEVHGPAQIVVVGKGQSPVAQILGAKQQVLNR